MLCGSLWTERVVLVMWNADRNFTIGTSDYCFAKNKVCKLIIGNLHTLFFASYKGNKERSFWLLFFIIDIAFDSKIHFVYLCSAAVCLAAWCSCISRSKDFCIRT